MPQSESKVKYLWTIGRKHGHLVSGFQAQVEQARPELAAQRLHSYRYDVLRDSNLLPAFLG